MISKHAPSNSSSTELYDDFSHCWGGGGGGDQSSPCCVCHASLSHGQGRVLANVTRNMFRRRLLVERFRDFGWRDCSYQTRSLEPRFLLRYAWFQDGWAPYLFKNLTIVRTNWIGLNIISTSYIKNKPNSWPSVQESVQLLHQRPWSDLSGNIAPTYGIHTIRTTQIIWKLANAERPDSCIMFLDAKVVFHPWLTSDGNHWRNAGPHLDWRYFTSLFIARLLSMSTNIKFIPN